MDDDKYKLTDKWPIHTDPWPEDRHVPSPRLPQDAEPVFQRYAGIDKLNVPEGWNSDPPPLDEQRFRDEAYAERKFQTHNMGFGSETDSAMNYDPQHPLRNAYGRLPHGYINAETPDFPDRRAQLDAAAAEKAMKQRMAETLYGNNVSTMREHDFRRGFKAGVSLMTAIIVVVVLLVGLMLHV